MRRGKFDVSCGGSAPASSRRIVYRNVIGILRRDQPPVVPVPLVELVLRLSLGVRDDRSGRVLVRSRVVLAVSGVELFVVLLAGVVVLAPV